MQTTTTTTETNAIASFAACAQGRKVEILWSVPSQTWDGRPKKKTLVRLMGVPFLVSEVKLPEGEGWDQEALAFPCDEDGNILDMYEVAAGWDTREAIEYLERMDPAELWRWGRVIGVL